VYDQAEKENQKCLTKYEEVQRPPTGTLRKLKFSVVDQKQKVDAARKKSRAASKRSQDSRNDLFLSLESTNAHQTTYYDHLLPFLIRKIDATFFENFQRYLVTFALQEKLACTSTMSFMDNIIAAANAVSRDAENSLFLTEGGALFTPAPAVYSFEPYPSDPVKAITVDEVSRIVLSTKLGKKAKRIEEIDEALARKRKEAESILKMTQAYENNPNFGRAADAQEEIDVIQFALEDLQLERLKLERQVKALTAVGVEALAPAASPKKASSRRRRVIALYDFTADRATDLTIHANDVITVLEDGDEWLRGELNGAQGLFPATYVRAYDDGAPSSFASAQAGGAGGSGGGGSAGGGGAGSGRPARARALYDFEGKDEGDLSFRAGDVIEVISRDDEWWEGRLNGRLGMFPMLFVEEEEDSLDTGSGTLAAVPGIVLPSAGAGDPSTPSSMRKAPSFVSIFTPPADQGEAKTTPATSTSTMPRSRSNPGTLASIAQGAPQPVVAGAAVTHTLSSSSDSGSLLSAPSSTSLTRKVSKKKSGPPPPSASGNQMVQALYDYSAQVGGELSFKKGDYIEVTNKSIGSDAWWEGELDGARGQFPKAYVKEFAEQAKASPRVVRLEALYDYLGQVDGELRIRAGDIIELVSREVPGDTDGAWWEGRLNGKVGQFPKNYVKEL